jgi:hypothetical protein
VRRRGALSTPYPFSREEMGAGLVSLIQASFGPFLHSTHPVSALPFDPSVATKV